MSDKPDSWRRLSSVEKADCRVFRVQEYLCERETDRKQSNFFVIESPDWVNVIALTPEKEVVLIEQFRYGTEEIILEIPGGMIDGSESAETAAKRELLEETGYSAERWVFLGISRPNPAIQNNSLFHYLALDCKKTAETAFDEHESLTTRLTPLDGIDVLIGRGIITHSLVVSAFYYLHLRNKRIL
jgi:8-oxo-dGTP pyrophosphatase MutT (NUDIX family)